MKVLLSDIAAAYGEPLYSLSRWKARGLPIFDAPALVEALANQQAGRVPPLVIRVASNPSILLQITAELKSLTKTSNEVPHP